MSKIAEKAKMEEGETAVEMLETNEEDAAAKEAE